MKRYMMRVSVLLLAGMLVSCGGGGSDSPSGGGNPAATDANPATTPATGSSSGPAPGSTPGPDTGGTPGPAPGTPGPATGTPAGDGGGTPADGGGVGTLPSAGARVEESNAAVIFSAGWTDTDERSGWSGGAARQSTAARALVTFKFTGTSVRWIGSRSRMGGIALVRVDGGEAKRVDLFARSTEIRDIILTIYDLSEGEHTLTIEVTGEQNAEADSNLVVVDAFDVEPPIVSHLQETDPDVAFSAGWSPADDKLFWSSAGLTTVPDPPAGGAKVAEAAGASVTLKFRGTSISWSGYRGPNAGIARVLVDGVATEVDTYSPAVKVQEVVFTAAGLADADHTLTIEATGLKNDASTGTQVVVDAFDVTTPGRRYQQDDPNKIIYTGKWNHGNNNRVWSEGTASTTSEPGARATFSFSGTSVSWISVQKASIGQSRVYIDGAPEPNVISNFKRYPIEGYQHTVFRKDGLTNGPHTLVIEAVSGLTVVDAFDVHP